MQYIMRLEGDSCLPRLAYFLGLIITTMKWSLLPLKGALRGLLIEMWKYEDLSRWHIYN